MSLKIKLDENILKSFQDLNDQENAIMSLLNKNQQRGNKLWESLQEKYSDLDFSSAKVNHEKGLLILPFEDEED